MKIAIVSNLYLPYVRGGAEIGIARVVTALLAQGHTVVVISSRPFGGWKTLKPSLEVRGKERIYRFFPLNMYHTLQDHKYPAFVRLFWHAIDAINPLNGLMVRKIIAQEKPDVVWTQNLKGIGLTIPRFLKGLNVLHVHQVHDVQLVVPSGLILAGHEHPSPLVGFGWQISAFVNRFLFDSPQIVLSPSKFLKSFYESWGLFRHSRVIVQPNPAPKVEPIERGMRQAGPLRLLYVGQMAEHKGIRLLIESLLASDLKFELSMAGEGPLADWVQKTAKADKRLVYVGFVSIAQLQQLFHMADALVVPSLCYENSPTVIYEAFASGLPVVAANIGGVGELICEGENGTMFAPTDPAALIAALKRIDADKEGWRSRASQIRTFISDYSMDRYIAKLIELFSAK